ncbi:MAG TPA: hypothetical protein VL095_16405 [Flavisolibacter sp.]|nr:hypothetical protein [Flavisolibacter sp.]
MLTYFVILILIVAFSAIGIRALIKERIHKRKQLRMAEAYDLFVRQFKLAVDYSEFLCYRYIGLDRKNKKLILIDHSGYEKQEQCVCLYEVGESKIIHTKDEDQSIKSVLLELRNKRNNKPVQFCFYNKDYDPLVELPSLSRKAIHWKTKVDIHKHRGNVSFEAEYVL